MKFIKIFFLFSFSILPIINTIAQPVWVPTTPSVPSTGPLSITANYGIDRIGTIYITVVNYDFIPIPTSAQVKAAAIAGPFGSRVATAVIPVSAGNINLVLNSLLSVINANTIHSVFIVAQDGAGVLQAIPIKLLCTTKPCPMINILTGFTQPVICVNKGAVATFEAVILNPDPNVNGILKGTQWTLDWGDGTVINYTSTADNDIPSAALRTHTYSTATTCNYVFSNTVRNPCGQTRAVQYIAVVHGRDIPSDGDGVLRVVDNATGSTTIQVCEGIQSVITLRDNSTWNCQNPVLPGGLTAVPNLDPRNIEWLYGRDPVGALTNTITGNVAVATLGNAPQASGRFSPTPYGPSSLSQAITIPATCVAGQYFRVYLKNWNKCNWGDPDYVYTSVDINVIAAPPAPTVIKPPICFGGNRTLTVTSPVVGTITWYSDALLTTVLGTGVSYTPVQTAPNSYDFWVTDRATSGLMCQGPATKVTLTINPLPNKPTITYTGALEFCFDGITTVVLRANITTPPAVTSYQWYKNGVAVAGATGNTLTLSQGSETGSYTVSSLGANPTNCLSPASDPVSVIIHSLSNLVNPVPLVRCQNGVAIFSASTTDLVQTWQWEESSNGGASFSTVGNGPPNSGFNTNTLTINPVSLSMNGYLYRVEIKTPPGQGGCPFKSGSAMLTVNPNAVITLTSGAGTNVQTPCISSPITNITYSVTGGGTGAGVAGLPAGVTGSYSGGVFTISGSPTATGTFNYTVTTTGTCTQATATGTLTVRPNNTITLASAVGTDNQTRCINTAITNIRYNTTGATGATYSGLPAGVSGVWAGNVVTISGTPTASGVFNYVITLTGGCGTITKNGRITVNPANTYTLTSAVGTDNQTVCISTALTSIRYSTTGATGATFSGLPAGVTGGWAANVVTISGTPTAAGTFNYTITSSGGCGPVTQTGTITVTPNNTIVLSSAVGTDNQTICISTPLTNITYTTTGATGATFASLPAGVTGAWAGNTVTISGTPTASGTFNYVITLTGGCGTITKGGTIRVNPNNTITLASAAGTDNQTICINTLLTNIRYNTTGATGATYSGLPAGVSGAWAGNVVTISGTPTASGTFNYVITLTGGCGTITKNGTITVNPAATANAGPDQSICPLGTVTLAGSVGGSVLTGSWSGGTGTYAPNNLSLTAVYTPSAAERAAKTVTLILTSSDPAGPCPAVTDNVTISIGTPLTAATLTGSGDACFGATSSISSVLTGGAPPYTINYTRNGTPQTAISPYTSGNSFNLGILPVGTYNYQITSVTDPCGNSVPPAGLPPVYTIHIYPIPDISGTVPISQTICSDGTANLTLNSTVNNTIFTYTVSTSPSTGYSWTAGKDPINGTITDTDGNGTESLTRQLQHNSVSAVTVFYAITATGPGATACPGAFVTTRSIIVNPVADINDLTATTCGGTAFSVTPVNGTNGLIPAGTTYSWPLPVVTGGLTGGATGAGAAVISGNLSNPTNTVQTATYTITPSSAGCPGPTFTVIVTVNPKPAITNMTGTACSGAAFTVSPVNVTNGIVPAGTTYSWAIPVVTGGLTGGAAGAGAANIGGTLVNPGNIPRTATYTVTPLSGTCTGATFTVIVTVNPTPSIANKTATICGGAGFTVTPVNGTDIVPAGTTYSWAIPVVTGGLTGGAAGAAAANISGTLTNPTNTVQSATYTVTPLSGACAGATFTVIVTVNPKPVIANKTATACGGAGFTVTPVNGTDIVPAGTTYSWAIPVVTGGLTGGAAGGAAANISGTLANPTNTAQTATYTVTPLSGTCTGATFTVIVTVNPKPVIANKTATTCGGTAFGVTPANGTDIVPAGTTYSWAIPVVTGGLTGGAAGAGAASIAGTLTNPTNTAQTATYTVTPLSGSCTGATFTVIVTVNPKPVIANKTATICGGAGFTVTPVNGTDIVPAGTTYSWAIPVVTGGLTGGAAGAAAANISGTLTNPTNTVQTATYTVTPLSGSCAGATFTVIVTVNPTPVIANKTASACGGSAFTVTPANGTDIVPAGTTYSWAIPVVTGGLTGGAAGVAAANISGTLANPTNIAQTATYTVTPLSGACTGATFTVIVTVNPKPVIANKTATTCGGAAFSVTPVNGTDIVPAGTTYSWAIPVVTGGMTGGAAGAGAASISGTLVNPTNIARTATYTVTPLSGTCAGATFTVIVTVNPTPVIANKTATACGGAGFTVTPVNGTDIVPAGTTYSWAIPVVTGGLTGGAAGGAAANISGTLTNPTNTVQTATYTVTPLSGTCTGATFTVIVTVNPKPVIANTTATTCGGTAFSITPANGTDIVPAGTTYSWAIPVVTGGLTGGAAGAGVAGITGTLTNPTNTAQTATYTVTPLSGTCTGATFTVIVTINPKPVIANKTATICGGAGFTVTPVNGTDIVPAGTTYSWAIPVVTGGLTGGAAGAAAANISGTLTNPTNIAQTATYTVTPLSGSCTGSTFTVIVTVNPTPVIANKTATACGGTAFTVTPVNGTDIVPASTTYSWAIPVVTGGLTGGAAGGGVANISGTLTNPTNIAQTATYTVTPLSGTCTGATFTVIVTVNPKPVIANKTATTCGGTAFSVTPANGTDIVPAGTTYSWPLPVVTGGLTGGAVGGGAAGISGTLTNPTNTAQTATYTVTPLSGGCTGATFTVIVTVNPTPVIANKTATACGGAGFTVIPVNGTDIVPAGTTYSWAIPTVTGGLTGGAAGAGAANISGTLTNPTNTAQTATYTVTPLSGTCTGATFTVIVTVNPKPVIANTTATTCGGTAFTVTPVNGTDIVPAGTTYSWAIPVVTGGLTGGAAGAAAGNISGTLTNPTYTAQTATYTVTPLTGTCTGATFTVIVTVNPKPIIANKTATICGGAGFTVTPVNGTDIVPAGITYSWAIPVVTGGLTGGAAGAAAANISGTLANPTNIAQTATYTVTPLSGSCTGSTFTVIVTVNPTPVIANKTATACGGAAFTVTPVNGTDIVPAGTTYSWAIPVVTGGLTGGAAGAAAANISGTLTNPTNIAQTATYTVTPLSGTCSGATFTVIVTVNPKPVIANKTATICGGAGFSVTPVNGTDIVPAGTTYSWPLPVVTGGLTGGAAVAGAASISGTLINPTNTAQTATYTVTPLTGTCTGATFTVIVTVNPTPVIANKTATTCGGTAFTVTPVNGTDIVPAGITYSWAIPTVTGGLTGGAAGAGAANISGTLTNPTNTAQTTTYTVTPLSGTCPGVTFTVIVTVNPTPVVANKTATTCGGTGFTVTPVNGTDIVPAGTTYSWAIPVVTGGLTGGTAGAAAANISGTLTNPTNTSQTATYTVTPLSGTCAGATFTVIVTVNPTPAIANKTATTCGGTGFTVTPANGADIVPAGTTYTWAIPVVTGGLTGGAAGAAAANISGTLANPTNIAQTATYTVTPLSGTCTGAAFTVIVTVNPTPAITNMTSTVCSGVLFTVAPVNTTNGIVPAGTTYSWPLPVVTGGITGGATGAGAAQLSGTLTNPSTTPQTATYTITPVSGACPGAPFTITVTVNPSGQVNQPGNQVLCNGATTTAVNFATLNSGGTTTYSWTNTASSIGIPATGSGDITAFAAVNTGTIPVVATIVVTPTFTNNTVGCAGSTKTFTITVNPTPSLTTTLTPADVCSNSVFSYAPASATVGTTFNWTRAAVAGITPAGPVSGTNNPNEILRNITGAPIAVTYQYTLAANGCSNVQNVVVNINPEPVITAGQVVTSCSGNPLNYQILLNNFVNPGGNVTFTWPVPVLNPVDVNFTGGTARGSATSDNITDTFTNTMGGFGTATYTVTPFKNGCAGTPVTVVINVGSEPVLDPGLNSFACSNTAIGLILKEAFGSVVPGYYNIISKTVAPGLTDAGNAMIPNATAPANYLSTDKFTNTTGVDKTVTYSVQPIFPPNCIGAAVDVVITIRPQPVILPAQAKTVCSDVAIGKEIVLVPANTPAGTLFSWPLPVMSDASVQGTTGTNVAADPAGKLHINDAIHNVSGAPITATYTITPVSSFGCAGTPTPAVMTINPEPVPLPISGRDKICVTDKNIVYNVTAVSGSSFHWTVDATVGTKTFDFNTNAILIDAAAIAGSGNITVYETNSYTCNGDISTKPVQVYTVPAPENIIGPAVACANSTQVYSVTSRVGSVYSWTIPGGAAIVGDPSASSVTIIFANVGGIISVRETIAAGCITNHNPFAVSVNPLPTAVISGGGTICEGGSRNLSVDFIGTGPYTFTYALNGVPQPPVNTSADPYTLNVTLAGTYTIVNVTDANCTNNGSGTTTVSYFPKPTGTISGTTEICNGSPATLTATFTGTAPFTFTYTDGTTPVTVTGHPTNVYTVSVSPIVNKTYTLTSLTDGNLCTGVVSGSAVITVNQPPVLSLSGTSLTCYNVSTGAVNMTITGGTAPFGITWTGPDAYIASTEDISGLKAGYYAVTVLDSKGCSATANITLTQLPQLSGSAAGTNITCFGASDGTITISGAAGGAGTYEFSANGGTAWQASPDFTGLAPGTYVVLMRDATYPTCILTLNGALLITQPAVLNATVVKTDVNCFAANNGSIVISAPSGGYGTYSYTINGGVAWVGSGNFTNLSPGNYDVRIRDAAHTACEVSLASLTITQPTVLSASVNSTNITCFGSTDGTITISGAAGGHGTYEYSINGGGSWQGSGSYTNLSPGTYNVQIRDAAFTGCYIVLNGSLVITQPSVLSASVASTNVTCNGVNDGIINITAPVGGHGTFEYSVTGGTSWQPAGLFNGLAPATYDVRIRDAANFACVIILNAGLQITEPAALSALVVDTDITCFGAADGIININNSAGGYGTYQYSINGGLAWQDSPTFSGLAPSTYDVRIRDKAHIACALTLDGAVVISQPAVLNAVVSSTNVTCFGAGDGTITVSSPTGGYGSYGYSINGGTSWQGSGSFTGLIPGTYNIRIRDAVHTGCIIALNPAVVITQPVVLSASIVKTNITCNGAADGSIIINGAAGGYGTYEYTVNGGTTWQLSNTFTGLIPGFYNVKIRDAANTGCIITLNGSLNVTEPALLNANVARTAVTCNGAANGTITISAPSGGYGTYQYSINGGGSWQASGSFTGLIPGNYVVQIRDAAQTACVITLAPL